MKMSLAPVCHGPGGVRRNKSGPYDERIGGVPGPVGCPGT